MALASNLTDFRHKVIAKFSNVRYRNTSTFLPQETMILALVTSHGIQTKSGNVQTGDLYAGIKGVEGTRVTTLEIRSHPRGQLRFFSLCILETILEMCAWAKYCTLHRRFIS